MDTAAFLSMLKYMAEEMHLQSLTCIRRSCGKVRAVAELLGMQVDEEGMFDFGPCVMRMATEKRLREEI